MAFRGWHWVPTPAWVLAKAPGGPLAWRGKLELARWVGDGSCRHTDVLLRSCIRRASPGSFQMPQPQAWMRSAAPRGQAAAVGTFWAAGGVLHLVGR